NTEVKLLSADGSWGFPPVRVGRRRANERTANIAVLFLLLEKNNKAKEQPKLYK
ncbi:hypothetical protein J2S25_003154, partial [Mesobacillus stamsii]|nr:hypothetical protein [Mesobacillus stamsii]